MELASRNSVNKLQPVVLAMLAIALMFSSHSCDEPLPPYQDPQKLFEARIDGEYWLSDTEHSLRVYLRVTNVFDETLEGPASLNGSIVISSAKYPNVQKTLLLSRLNLTNPRGYDPNTGSLRIDSKETMIFRATWDFVEDKVIDDSGRNLAGDSVTASFFTYIEDKTCKWRKLARPEDFILQGTLKILYRTAPVTAGPTVFPFCFVTNFVDVRVCPQISTIPPCSNWPQKGE